MTLPLAKLAGLALKQIAKPCSNVIKRSVKGSELLGNIIAMPAQVYHRLEQRVRMRLLGWKKEVTIKPLNKKAAIDLGAELTGEFFLFGFAVCILYAELRRSSAKEKKKEEAQEKRFSSLQFEIDNLQNNLDKQADENSKLLSSLSELVKRIEMLQSN